MADCPTPAAAAAPLPPALPAAAAAQRKEAKATDEERRFAQMVYTLPAHLFKKVVLFT